MIPDGPDRTRFGAGGTTDGAKPPSTGSPDRTLRRGRDTNPDTNRALLVEVQTWHAEHYARWAEVRDRLKSTVEAGDPFHQTDVLFTVVLARHAREVNQWSPLLDELHHKLGGRP